jgi:saccharopine dehydrogenase-like NADP-dependent oxidoreductase
MKIIVLGAGLVGGPMALDLAADERFTVTVADRDPAALAWLAGRGDLRTVPTDFADPGAVSRLVADFDLVLGAEPSHLAYRLLEAVIPVGRPVVDIAFLAEDPFGLDDLARSHGVPVLVDCGVFPGMGSVLIGRADRLLDRLDSVTVYVGGLPVERRPPFEYATVFSPHDVIAEYTRPSRLRVDGREVERPALSEPELVELPGVDTLEAFNTDGLRTLLRTLDAPNLREKTLRYPGHIDKMRLLRDCGFFGNEPVDLDGGQVRPVDLTARLIFPLWELQPGESELTVMRIIIDGHADGRPVRWTYDLLDRTDHERGVTSMARTTGYTATMAVRALADGLYGEPGITPPEYLGRVPGCTSFLLAGLANRGVVYRESREERPGTGS